MKIHIINEKIANNIKKLHSEYNHNESYSQNFQAIFEQILSGNVITHKNDIYRSEYEEKSINKGDVIYFEENNKNADLIHEKSSLKDVEPKDLKESKEELFLEKENIIHQQNIIEKKQESSINEFKDKKIVEEQLKPFRNQNIERYDQNQNNTIGLNTQRNLYRFPERIEIKKRTFNYESNLKEYNIPTIRDFKKEIQFIEGNIKELKKNLENPKLTKITANLFFENFESKENQISNIKVKHQILENQNQKLGLYKNNRITVHNHSEGLVKELLKGEINKNTDNQKTSLKETLLENQITKTEFFEKDIVKTFQTTKLEMYQKVESKQKFEHGSEQKDPQQNLMNFSLNLQKQIKVDSQSVSQDVMQKTIKEAVEQMISMAKIQVGHEQFSAQIRLNPSMFGFMSINMNYENGSLILKILVDNQEIYKKLQENLESIKYEFSKNGIHLETIQIKFKESSNEHYDSQFSMMFDANSHGSQGKNGYIEHHEEAFFIDDKENSTQTKYTDDNQDIDPYESTLDIEEDRTTLNFIKTKIYWG